MQSSALVWICLSFSFFVANKAFDTKSAGQVLKPRDTRWDIVFFMRDHSTFGKATTLIGFWLYGQMIVTMPHKNWIPKGSYRYVASNCLLQHRYQNKSVEYMHTHTLASYNMAERSNILQRTKQPHLC